MRWRPRPGKRYTPAQPAERVAANVAALRVLVVLAEAERPALPEEQAVLARWSGWGAVPGVFDEDDDRYAAAREELRALVSGDEWAAARRTTLNAHYTDPSVVTAMWDGLAQMGFTSGRVLEPGCGSGHFIGFAEGRGAEMIGVDRDPTSARIAQALYPDAEIHNVEFQRFDLTDPVDAVIGNVPFAKTTPFDPRHNRGKHRTGVGGISEVCEFMGFPGYEGSALGARGGERRPGLARRALMVCEGNFRWPPGRPRGMRWVPVVLVVVAAAACGGRGESQAGDTATETYSSDIDGLAVSYPTTWHRAEAPLAAALVGDQVEVLGLATGELPQAEQGCSPYPWAAMRALGAEDVVLTLNVSVEVGILDEWAEEGREPLASKPDDLLGQEPMPPAELPGGCAVDGVEQRNVDFLAHGRRYTAFLAYSGNLSEQRREELRAVWSSLTLRPIPTADGSATIGERYWHVLYTHCGIVGTQFAGRDWVAEPVLDDGNGNPPADWGNPWQPGVMTLTSQDSAEFESRDGGLEATFRPRTPADPPAPPCA